MAHNQGGIQDIKTFSGVSASAISTMQGAAPSYSFGDITRVGKFEQGGQIAKAQGFNVNNTWADDSRVGLNPFNELIKATSTKQFIA